jgi:hypothetical protein
MVTSLVGRSTEKVACFFLSNFVGGPADGCAMSFTDGVSFTLLALVLVAAATRFYFIRREREQLGLGEEIARAVRQAKGDYSD